MSICTACFDGETIPKCAEQLIVGDTLLPEGTELRLYFKILSTGFIGYVNAEVNDVGQIVTGRTIDGDFVYDPLDLPSGSYVELWVVEESEQVNITDRVIFQINLVNQTCIEVKVQAIGGEYVTYDLTATE
jgi:hypothetical protein